MPSKPTARANASPDATSVPSAGAEYLPEERSVESLRLPKNRVELASSISWQPRPSAAKDRRMPGCSSLEKHRGTRKTKQDGRS
jgi:hypothetical protein